MEHVKKFNESMWKGVVSRSSGDIVREEDKKNPIEMDNEACVEVLKQGICCFVYRKVRPKNAPLGTVGKLRIAWGTKNYKDIDFPLPKNPYLGSPRKSGDIYMDIEAENWRIAYEILGGYDKPFTKEEYDWLPADRKMKYEEDLLIACGLKDEMDAQRMKEHKKTREVPADVSTQEDLPL